MEIHAAIVGGFISGIVVLLGVLVAEWLRRQWDRRQALQRATQFITRQLPIAMVYLTEHAPGDRHMELDSPGWTFYQQVMSACAEADAASRPRWTRRHNEVRAALDDITARMSAADLRWTRDGIYVTTNELISISTAAAQLTHAVFGKRKTIDEAFTKYVKHGLGEGHESNTQRR